MSHFYSTNSVPLPWDGGEWLGGAQVPAGIQPPQWPRYCLIWFGIWFFDVPWSSLLSSDPCQPGGKSSPSMGTHWVL